MHGRYPLDVKPCDLPLVWKSDLGTYPLPPDIRLGDLHCPLPFFRHQTSGPTLLLLTSGGHHWRPVQTCPFEDLPLSCQYRHLVVATETHGVGKRAVRILRECSLVLRNRHTFGFRSQEGGIEIKKSIIIIHKNGSAS